MRAAVLTSLESIDIRDIPDPQITSADEVLLRISRVGLCGSDIHYFRHGRIGDQVVSYPFIVGHECAAKVVERGAKVEKISPGECVVVDPAVSCGVCDQCRAGRRHTCRNLRFLGCPGQREGCLCELMVLPAENCYPFPEHIDISQGPLIEPLAIGIYTVDFLKDQEIRSLGVLGCGPIGLSVLLAAKAAGASAVYATDKIKERLDAARLHGAVWTGNPEQSDVVSDILNHAGELDAVVECCGDQEALDQAVELLKPGGELLILGIPDVDRVSFDISHLRRKEIRIQNVRRQNRCTPRAIDLVSSERIEAGFMATHTFDLDAAQKAFELVAGYGDGVIKAQIILGESGLMQYQTT